MLLETGLYRTLKRLSQIKEENAWMFTFLNDRNLKHDIIKLIQTNQLEEKGVDEDGNVIGYYSMLTQMISGGKKRFNEHYTLKDTGEFFKTFYITVLRDSFIINADGQKEDENLFDKYGEGIIGLTDESLEIVAQRIRDGYINYIFSLIG